MKRTNTLLLLGPTGSGKTPIGAFCEQKGLWGKQVFHFDFGALLRKIAATGPGFFDLADRDIEIIHRSLQTGALLENKDFHIAKNVLMSFKEKKQMQENDLLMLNGLPRHVDQAKAIDTCIDVKIILLLDCGPEVVSQRIQLNAGGDRSARIDDSFGAVEKKLKIFRDRTMPLLNHYQHKDVSIEKFQVEINTKPEDIHQCLAQKYHLYR
jgi:adenylate kinase